MQEKQTQSLEWTTVTYPNAFFYEVIFVAFEFVFESCGFGLVLHLGLFYPCVIFTCFRIVGSHVSEAFPRFKIAGDIGSALGFDNGSLERIDAERDR